jgi:peroxiredoxin
MTGRSAFTLIAIAVTAGALFTLFVDRTPDPIGPGQPAPLFSLPSLAGNEPVALETLRGRVVLLHFWATWCKPCEEEMAALERLRRSLDSHTFALLTVSVDEDRSQVESYRDRLGLSLPILLDPSHEVSRAYQTYRYPESFLLDREGKVVARFVGPREWDAQIYVDRIRELLGSAPRPKTDGPALSDARGAR